MSRFTDITDKLHNCRNAEDEELLYLLKEDTENDYLYNTADKVRRLVYEDKVYIRGLIEFTNYCKNDCLYCGIRKSNRCADRYRLDKETILSCCDEGYHLGYRTFVLQGGEDPFFTDEKLCDIIYEISSKYSDCAVTLSVGERSKESYKKLYECGAKRYLLRHESANEAHYKKLHPENMSLDNRKRCLFDLKAIGYQVGAGIMIGSPYQTLESLIDDLRFMQELQPDMIGIGPFIHHNETPFRDFPDGSAELTLKMLSICRLVFPYALIPSTTALGTLVYNGREQGLKAGANVVMPNLSPVSVRNKYDLYENKICTGEESAQCRECLERRVEKAGYRIVTDIGNVNTKYKNGAVNCQE